jgi:hypothetical protein
MARIIAYPYANSPISEDDCLLGTQKDNGSTNQSNPTKNFSVGSVVTAGLGYTAYTALISQSGTNAPTATVLKNNTGHTYTWTRTAAGKYEITANGNAFTANKTAVFINYGNPSSDGLPPKWVRTSDTLVKVSTQDETAVLDDNILNGAAFEIRIYS